MTQLTFQNIRNLGANGNQPLITNQNDFQIFDNVTWIKGKHTVKTGGSLTLRSREILNADSIVGVFNFNNNMTSNCAGQTAAGCSVNTATGFDVASFMLGLVNTKARNLFDANTYTEKRPEYTLYVQDDYRVTNRLTLNLGLRWDVYCPGSRLTTASRTSTSRPAPSSSPPTMRLSTESRSGGICRPIRSATSVRGSASPTT